MPNKSVTFRKDGKRTRENRTLKWWRIGRWRCHGRQQSRRKTGKRAQWSRRTIHSCNHSPDRQLDAPQGWNRKPLSPSILETWQQPHGFFSFVLFFIPSVHGQHTRTNLRMGTRMHARIRACVRFAACRFHVACKCCLLSDASAHRKVITPHATAHRIVADIWPHG